MPISKYGDFPEFDQDEENQTTRPIPLPELPKQVQIEHNMAIIREQHERIAKAIEMFWGHKDCVEYLQQMILNGGDGVGRARVGFKLEVLAAFMSLIALHEIDQA